MSILMSVVEAMTETIMAGIINTGIKGNVAEAKAQMKQFLIENYDRLGAFVKEHPGIRPPIYFIEELGGPVWLNRKQKRSFDARRTKAAARLARG